jgi:hypothetical protein
MNSRTRYQLFLVGLLWSALFLITPPEVNAAGRIGRAPISLGMGDGLVGYWSFDGKDVVGVTAYDRSGQGNKGTFDDTPFRAIGKIGQGLLFRGGVSGPNGAINVGTPSSLNNLRPLTLSLWINPGTNQANSNDKYVITKSGLGLGWSLKRLTSSGVLDFFYQFTGGNVGRLSATAPPSNEWTHVAVSWDGTSAGSGINYYFNGVLNNNASGVDGSGDTTDDSGITLGIAGDVFGGTNYLNGSIDDVRIYNRVLSPDEVKRLYKMGATAKTGVVPQRGTLADGLVAYWSFDGKDIAGRIAYDRSGQAVNGSLENGPARAIGKLGQGLNFDKIDDLMDLGSPAALDLNQRTISVWIYPRSVGENGDGQIIQTFNGGSIGWNLEICDSTDSGFFNDCASHSTNNALNFGYTFSGDDGNWMSNSNAITLNAWNHITVTYDRTSASNDPTFYVNGQSITVNRWGTPTGSADSGTVAVTIGNRNTADATFDGFIDDFRIYNRILSTDEIKRLYKMGATEKIGVSLSTGSLSSGLVGHWTFDGKDVVGVTAYDRSGQGNNGTLTNEPARAIGKIGQGLEFDGADDYVSIPIDLSSTQTVYFSFWAYRSSYIVNAKTLELTPNMDGSTEGLTLNFDDSAGGCGTKLAVYLKGNVGYSGACYTWPTTGTWHHYIAVYDKSLSTDEVNLYIDGLLQTPASRPDNSNNTNTFANDTLYLMSTEGTSRFDAGKMDDVRIYNRVLSADEVKRLYLMGR